MKKLLLISLLLSKSVLIGQTVLNSFPLNLNTSSENAQTLNVEDIKTNDIYVFAADDKNINILKYNKSLFLTSQFTDSIRTPLNRSLSGYSIADDGNPLLYWSSSNTKNLKIVKYFLDSKTSRTLNFDFPENNEYIITSFQKNNAFYVLGKEKGQKHLLLYEFQNGKCEIKMFDFSDFNFQTERGQGFTFNLLVRNYPIQKIESDDFNTLDKTSGINKMYVLDDHIILTFDYNTQKTQVFDLNLQTLDVIEKTFIHPSTKKQAKSANSFYSDGKLFQIKANNDEFLYDIKDFASGQILKSVSVSKNDTIRFKNSPLLVQANNQKPQELKTTAKFLKNLSDLSAGISVFKHNNKNYVTFGGFVEYVFTNYNSLDDVLGEFGIGGRPYYDIQNKMVFFDSTFDSNLNFISTKQSEPLAIDNIYYYLSTNKNVSLQNILKLKDYYILSYYDNTLRQFILRKFTDGIIREDNGNPIMNKSVFSKPASFDPIKSR